MNKAFLLVIGLALSWHGANCQSNVGFKAGLNYSNQVKSMSIPQLPTIVTNTEPFVGYHFGGFYKTRLNKNFFLSTEINFSVVGSGMRLITSDLTVHDVNEKIGYIEIPLTVQYFIKKFYFGAGPSVGFKVFSKLTNFENRSWDLNYQKKLDAAGNVLVGCRITERIDLNVRYSHGVLNIYADPGYAVTKNRFFSFSVLYALK